MCAAIGGPNANAGDKGQGRLCAAGRAADNSHCSPHASRRRRRTQYLRATTQTPRPQDHKPHQIYAEASGAAAALASALRFALARALDLRASACSVKAFSRAFSPLSLWIASMSTRLFLYWLPFAAM